MALILAILSQHCASLSTLDQQNGLIWQNQWNSIYLIYNSYSITKRLSVDWRDVYIVRGVLCFCCVFIPVDFVAFLLTLSWKEEIFKSKLILICISFTYDKRQTNCWNKHTVQNSINTYRMIMGYMIIAIVFCVMQLLIHAWMIDYIIQLSVDIITYRGSNPEYR